MYFLIAALLSFTGAGIGRAQEVTPENKFKAAYLYHFAQLVGWPPEAFSGPTGPLTIAVIGQSPVADELERTLRGKMVNGHPVVIRTVHTAAEARTNVHVLFISSSEKPRMREIISGLSGASVLTVGDTEDFIEAGGMIRLFFLEKKLKFEIKDEAAKAANVTIPAKLLSLSVKP